MATIFLACLHVHRTEIQTMSPPYNECNNKTVDLHRILMVCLLKRPSHLQLL